MSYSCTIKFNLKYVIFVIDQRIDCRVFTYLHLHICTYLSMNKFFFNLNSNQKKNIVCFLSLDKQQEFDLPSMRFEENTDQNVPVPQIAQQQQQRSRSPRDPPMSQISGVKRPLSHTNSFTGERLPTYGVETTHEAALGTQLAELDTWGIDIFKIGDLSSNRPLTCVAYTIFQASFINGQQCFNII